MNWHVIRYKQHLADGLSLEVAFTAVASDLPLDGTMEDLKQLTRAYDEDSRKRSKKLINESEEIKNEKYQTA